MCLYSTILKGRTLGSSQIIIVGIKITAHRLEKNKCWPSTKTSFDFSKLQLLHPEGKALATAKLKNFRSLLHLIPNNVKEFYHRWRRYRRIQCYLLIGRSRSLYTCWTVKIVNFLIFSFPFKRQTLRKLHFVWTCEMEGLQDFSAVEIVRAH